MRENEITEERHLPQSLEQASTDTDETRPVRRYLIASILITLGSVMIFAPIPGVGRISELLLASPFFLILVTGWYVGRTSIASYAHYQQLGRRARGEAPNATPSISILVPAYNEESTVAGTVESIEKLEYDGEIETVVVDDGSTDDTWSILQFLAGMHDNLRVFTQPNGGSSVARNTALEHAQNEVVISLDADTELHADALTEIARHFTSDEIVAVGGNVSIENTDSGSWWSKTQLFDYSAAMELGRMFQSQLGYVLCLSGAFGAFRRATLVEAGGWNVDRLYSDDFEVTVRMQEYGDVKYSPYAIADTEAPETIREWFGQRRAWAQRGVSVMLLHYKKMFSFGMGAVGMIGLPLRAILTIGIMSQVVGFALSLTTSAVTLVDVAGFIVVGTIVTSAFSFVMTGVLLILLVNEKPIKYAGWLIVFLTIYRPLHLLARLNGFGQALWWEVSSFGQSLRESP